MPCLNALTRHSPGETEKMTTNFAQNSRYTSRCTKRVHSNTTVELYRYTSLLSKRGMEEIT